MNPNARIDDVMAMDARLSAAVAQPRFYAVLAGVFGALALFLAAFGVHALLSYTVSRRRREIGLRMALGAQRRDAAALVVRQGCGLAAAGVVLGLLASAASVRLIESFLFGVAAADRLVFWPCRSCWSPSRSPPAGCRRTAPSASPRWTRVADGVGHSIPDLPRV